MANADRMTIDEYLSNHSKTRRIDIPIKKWFVLKNGPQYCIKTKKEWDKVIDTFFSEKI